MTLQFFVMDMISLSVVSIFCCLFVEYLDTRFLKKTK
jgi:hypothetical protein